jgi:hypothetical protein
VRTAKSLSYITVNRLGKNNLAGDDGWMKTADDLARAIGIVALFTLGPAAFYAVTGGWPLLDAVRDALAVIGGAAVALALAVIHEQTRR